MTSKELYNFLIQRSIANYMKYKINYENLEIQSILDHFSKVRNVIAKIMFSINNSLKEDTFCKKKELEEFGKWRSSNDNDLIITPFYGKYNNIVDIESFLNNGDINELNLTLETKNIVLIKKMYKSDPSIKIIQNNKIYGNLSILYYERDNYLIKSIENIYPKSDLIEENSLLYRCVFHTESNLHASIIDHINKITSTFSNDNKDKREYLFEIFWFMCQASFFYRGSASISEMVISVLYNVVRKNNEDNTNKLYSVDFKYGSDVHAIVNDLESFKLIANNMIKLNETHYNLDLNLNDFSIDDLEIFAESVKYKSKTEVKDIINKIIYEKRNLKDAIIVYKQVPESNILINNLLEEFT